jgi:hypothetical protein
LRLGPLIRRIDLDIVWYSMLKLNCGDGTARGFDGICLLARVSSPTNVGYDVAYN